MEANSRPIDHVWQPERTDGGISNLEKRTVHSKQRPHESPNQRNTGHCPVCRENPGQRVCDFCGQRSASRAPSRGSPSNQASGPGHTRSRSRNGKSPVRKEGAAQQLQWQPRPVGGCPSQKVSPLVAGGSKPASAHSTSAPKRSKRCASCLAEMKKKKSKNRISTPCAVCGQIPMQMFRDDVCKQKGTTSLYGGKDMPSPPHHEHRRKEDRQGSGKRKVKSGRRKPDVYGYLPCLKTHPRGAHQPFDPNGGKPDYAEYTGSSGRFIRNPLTVSACACDMQPRGRPPKAPKPSKYSKSGKPSKSSKPPPPPFCPAGSQKVNNYFGHSDMQDQRHSAKPPGYGLPPLINNQYNRTNFVPQAYFSDWQSGPERSTRKDHSSSSRPHARDAMRRTGTNSRPENQSQLARPRFSVPNRRLSGSGIRCSVYGQYLRRSLRSKMPPTLKGARLLGVPKKRSVKPRSVKPRSVKPRSVKPRPIAEKTTRAKPEESNQLRRAKARSPSADATEVERGLETLRYQSFYTTSVESSRSSSMTWLAPSAIQPEAAESKIAPRSPASQQEAPGEPRLPIASAVGESPVNTRVRFYRGSFLSIRPHFPFESPEPSTSPSLASHAVAEAPPPKQTPDTGKPVMLRRAALRLSSFVTPKKWQINGFVAASPIFGHRVSREPPVGTKAAGGVLRKLWPNWLFNGKARTTRA